MRILFTGGGTGGHFYPIIAVKEAVHDIVEAEHYRSISYYYMSDAPYNRDLLQAHGISYYHVPAGKIRPGFSFVNVLDMAKTAVGIFIAVVKMFFIFPDVVFGKGGYASAPALAAARFFGIPIVIHESDTVPGRVNKWAGKFAVRVAVSYADAAEYFDRTKTAYTGQPIRKDILTPSREGTEEYFHLESGLPVIGVLGGSQGAQAINDAILDILPELLMRYNVIHQVGAKNKQEVELRTKIILENNPHTRRYFSIDFLDEEGLRRLAASATLVISRAGSTIFELAQWGTPSILIPIPEDTSHDQTSNAVTYARSGAATVLEQNNLTPHILLSEISRILDDKNELDRMSRAAHGFAKQDAAGKIARELIEIASLHE